MFFMYIFHSLVSLSHDSIMFWFLFFLFLRWKLNTSCMLLFVLSCSLFYFKALRVLWCTTEQLQRCQCNDRTKVENNKAHDSSNQKADFDFVWIFLSIQISVIKFSMHFLFIFLGNLKCALSMLRRWFLRTRKNTIYAISMYWKFTIKILACKNIKVNVTINNF